MGVIAMLFSEIYGSYFNAVAAVLSQAVKGSLTKKGLNELVQKTAFGESNLTIPAALADQSWPLLETDMSTPLQHRPTMPLSLMQKQWLKALLQDPRIKLFSPPEEGLEDIEPLYTPDTFVYYDRYTDGDPFEDPVYIGHFQTILQGMREKRKIRVKFRGRRAGHSHDIIPYKLEYSAKDDKFRLLTALDRYLLTINVSRIRSLELLEPYTEEEYRPVEYREKSLVMELTDERNALERVMLHFSDLEKETEKIGDRKYRITIRYKQSDDMEMLIRLLSFGSVLRVLEPEEMVKLIRIRLKRQAQYLQQTE